MKVRLWIQGTVGKKETLEVRIPAKLIGIEVHVWRFRNKTTCLVKRSNWLISFPKCVRTAWYFKKKKSFEVNI